MALIAEPLSGEQPSTHTLYLSLASPTHQSHPFILCFSYLPHRSWTSRTKSSRLTSVYFVYHNGRLEGMSHNFAGATSSKRAHLPHFGISQVVEKAIVAVAVARERRTRSWVYGATTTFELHSQASSTTENYLSTFSNLRQPPPNSLSYRSHCFQSEPYDFFEISEEEGRLKKDEEEKKESMGMRSSGCLQEVSIADCYGLQQYLPVHVEEAFHLREIEYASRK